MEIPSNSSVFRFQMQEEPINKEDVKSIKKWARNNSFKILIILLVLVLIFVACVYVFLQFKNSGAIWTGLICLVLIGLLGGSLLFYSHTGKTLAEKKKRTTIVTISEKSIKNEFENGQKVREMHYIYFGSELVFATVHRAEWEKCKVGQKIKFHFLLDQDAFFRYETVE